MPNTDGHIHLEKQLKSGIWDEYKADFKYRGYEALSYDNFCKIWRTSFPHVKIRAYKQVSGKILLSSQCNVRTRLTHFVCNCEWPSYVLILMLCTNLC